MKAVDGMTRTETLKQRPKRILTEKARNMLDSFQDDEGGYFRDMLHYLEAYLAEGIKAGRFAQEESQEDLETALWYSYACNNIDAYEYYYMVTQWMPFSRKHAGGCAVWFYRYSVALMYCNRLEEALASAEQGAVEDPVYPWIWLQVAKLRNHFHGKEKALEAVRKGLELVPGNYEFQTLEEEIRQGATLVEMCCHLISPVADMELKLGKEEKAKIHALSGILCDKPNLSRIKNLFSPREWVADAPYCWFYYPIQDRRVKVVFCMNEAALSHFNLQWMKESKRVLDCDTDAIIQSPRGTYGVLEQVEFRQGYRMMLQYREVLQ